MTSKWECQLSPLGNRGQEGAQSARDVLGIIPVKDRGVREQEKAKNAFSPWWGSDPCERRQGGKEGWTAGGWVCNAKKVGALAGSSSTFVYLATIRDVWKALVSQPDSSFRMPSGSTQPQLKMRQLLKGTCTWSYQLTAVSVGGWLLKGDLIGCGRHSEQKGLHRAHLGYSLIRREYLYHPQDLLSQIWYFLPSTQPTVL